MTSWHEFIFMGVHGGYVWSSYLMTFVVLLGLFVGFKKMLKSLKAQVQADAAAPSAQRQKARKLKVTQPD